MSSTATNSNNTQKPHSSSFGQTLQFITSIKLSELEKQSIAYKAHSESALAVSHSVLHATSPTTAEVIKAVEQLSKCIKSWTGSGSLSHAKPYTGIVSGTLQLKNLEYWLQQAAHDPEFAVQGGSDYAKRWLRVLESHIKKTQMRFDAAMLFGRLFNEWIGSGNSSAVVYQGPGEDDADEGSLAGASEEASTFSEFVEVGRKEMYEQKQKLISIIFDAHPIDTDALTSYLEDLFSGDEARRALERLRVELKLYGNHLLQQKLTKMDVSNAIKGLLTSGLMDEEKRTTLKAFQENSAAMEELASVLSMRIAGLGGKDGWKWPEEGVRVEMRRALNGKYRAFTDPDIIDALLLQHLGIAWQVKLKQALIRFFDSKAWSRPPPVPHHLREKWKAQLGDDGSHSIQNLRKQNYRKFFFVSQLSDSLKGAQAYDDLVDAPDNANNNDDDGYPSNDPSKSPAQIKQKLLNIIQTECYLNTSLHGTHTILRSDLEWFGPSLPHQSILTVLEFLGMGKKWVRFYKEFLEAPVKFTGAGGFGEGVAGGQGTEEAVRVRQRGTPISYALSVVCGEAVLFIMDYAVNRRSGAPKTEDKAGSEKGKASEGDDEAETSDTQREGVCLYRMHDDLWVWDRKKENVARAWTEMRKFAGLAGLKFNEAKTGCVVVGQGDGDKATTDASTSTSNTAPIDTDDDLVLPNGDIRWGFLLFSPSTSSSTSLNDNPTSAPRFVIDQAQVDQHIKELRRQLAATKSVFGWVNLWNKYMRFFVRNFGAAGGTNDDGSGKMANCAVEREAVVDVVDTLARIQREVFEGDDATDLGLGGQPATSGKTRTALEYLRSTLESRFGVKDLPDGYFYFPISSGGLEIWNPMVEVLAMERRGKPLIAFEEKDDEAKSQGKKKAKTGAVSDSDEEDSDEGLNSESDETEDTDSTISYSTWDDEDDYYFPEDKYLASSKFPARMRYDRKAYKTLKEAWDTNEERRRGAELYAPTGFRARGGFKEPKLPQGDYTDEFMSKEEYESLREGWLKDWAESYEDMLEYVDMCEVVCVPKVRELIAANAGGAAAVPVFRGGRGRGRGRGAANVGRGGAVGLSPAQRAISEGWESMSFYDRWITSVYGEEVVERFGGLDVVDQSLIPVGMVQLFKTSRMKLDQ
ncbi:hypothetical protein CVT24_008178 [Panaeolus cyanescens]|uniref:Reverse transcriptase domain-containing protein n=1 Tax=Panaeolus cyanescens TaxID=181874 RepID=A0A409VFK2_9AGAR|nr:hypothetical protein CVT24_008178 [Panaeolus cyanescens]